MVGLGCRGHQRGAISRFKGQLHVPVIILVFFAATEIMQYNKPEQRNVLLFFFMFLEMLQQHRQL